MPQFARPNGDSFVGVWTTAPLWSKLDEGGAGDGVVVLSDNNPGTSEAFVCSLSDVTDPGVSTGHILRIRWAKNAAGGADYDVDVELRQGYVSEASLGTLIGHFATPIDDDTTNLRTDSQALSGAEADAITDYTNLQLRVFAVKTGGGPGRQLKVDFIEFEVPDAVASDDLTLVGIRTGAPTIESATLGQVHALALVGLRANPEVDAAALGQVHVLAADSIETTPTVEAVTLGVAVALDLDGLVASPEVDAVVLGQEHALTANGVRAPPEIDALALGQVHALSADGLRAGPRVDAAALGQVHALALDGLRAAPPTVEAMVLGVVAGSDDLALDGLRATPEVDAANLGQVHVLAVDGIATTPTVAAGTIGQVHALGLAGIETTPTVDPVTLGVVVALSLDAIEAGPEVDPVALGQVHALTAIGIKATPRVASTSLNGASNLNLTGIKAGPEVDATAIGQVHVLTADSVTTAPTVESATLGQAHTLNPQGIQAGPTVGAIALGQQHALAADDIETTPTVGSITLETTGTLNLDGISTTPTVDSLALGQIHVLAVAGIKTTPEVDAVTLDSTALPGAVLQLVGARRSVSLFGERSVCEMSGNGPRTLSLTGNAMKPITAAVNDIPIESHVTVTVAAAGIDTGDTVQKAWLTLKDSPDDADPGVMQLVITSVDQPPGRIESDGTGDGIAQLRFEVQATDSAGLEHGKYYDYDVRVLTTAGRSFPVTRGTWLFSPRVTHAIA